MSILESGALSIVGEEYKLAAGLFSERQIRQIDPVIDGCDVGQILVAVGIAYRCVVAVAVVLSINVENLWR